MRPGANAKGTRNNWAWLGAALSGTAFPFGSLAIPGGSRYHPAVLAHLVATLAELFPSRLPWIALGSGEALNESVVGSGWPSKDERNARLRALADILRALFRGDTVTAHHPWFDVDDAKLWSLPATPPRLYGAALTPETAAWLGPWADGLITVRKPRAELRMVAESFVGNGGFGKPMALQLQVSWSETRDEARIGNLAHRNVALSERSAPEVLEDLQRLRRKLHAGSLHNFDNALRLDKCCLKATNYPVTRSLSQVTQYVSSRFGAKSYAPGTERT